MAGVQVVVIGGGIGGLAVANGLRHAGFDAQVYERSAEETYAEVGLRLWRDTLNRLDRLGLDALPADVQTPDHSLRYLDRDGRRLIEYPSAATHAGTDSSRVVVHRKDLQKHLLSLLGPESVHRRKLCVRVENHEQHVTAYFADGTSVTGELLIGADGPFSTVRSQIHGRVKPQYTGTTYWQAVTEFDPQNLNPGVTWGLGARFSRHRLSGNRVYWYATGSAPVGTRSPDGEKAELLRRFGDWHAPIPELLRATDESNIRRIDIFERPPVPFWHEGRMVLLGDAAHPMPPDLSMGACLALEDAFTLTECLSSMPYHEAFPQYEGLRREATTRLSQLSRQFSFLGSLENPLAVWLRNQLARNIVDRLPNAWLSSLSQRVLKGLPL